MDFYYETGRRKFWIGNFENVLYKKLDGDVSMYIVLTCFEHSFYFLSPQNSKSKNSHLKSNQIWFDPNQIGSASQN